MQEEVGNCIFVAGNMFDGVVEVLEIFDPSSLVARNFLGLIEVLKVLVVGINLHRLDAPRKKGCPILNPKMMVASSLL